MLYLEEFILPTRADEEDFFASQTLTCYNSYYPFQFFPDRGLHRLEFEPVTILYGGNGSGKSTILNVMADFFEVSRDTPHNSTSFWGNYLDLCDAVGAPRIPRGSRFVCSDDVFDYMLNLRELNSGIDDRRERLFDEFLEARYSNFQLHSIEDYERLKQANEAKRRTKSQYVRRNLAMNNVRTLSNGESALRYFAEKVRSDALYLLDEPENSLSAQRQQELAQFLFESARFYNCQLVIATHSPFLLAIPGARIYDLDSAPPRPRRWTELESVRIYYDFFARHRAAFEDTERK